MNGNHLIGLRIRKIGVRDRAPVDYVHGAIPDDIEVVPKPRDDRRILVDADADQPRILRHRAEQATDAPALCEVLVLNQI
ncbi:MAG TPA: hypothetical protein VLI90_20430, partial [Tepidisphaeraceae bacterium]|nr:hypothetical protein [Tepidisphaeraceae bacterium]